MIFQIEETKNIEVTETAQDVRIAYRAFLISNTGSGVVYIKCKDDGENATTSDFAIPAGIMLPMALTCDVLSIVGSGSVRLAFGSIRG